VARKRRRVLPVLVVLVVAAGVSVAALRYAGVLGGTGPVTTIGVDLPLQGPTADDSTQTFNAMQLYLKQTGGKVNGVTINLATYDDSTTAKATYDEGACTRNANAHIARTDEVAVIGPMSAGCARVEAKVLAAGNLVMVSPAITFPGLTVPWNAGEPANYEAGGVRSFARVVPNDADQGSAAGAYAATTGVTRCLVLNDGETYGKQLAARFADAARIHAVTVTDGGSWDPASASYLDLFNNASGVDCVYLAGNYDNNGQQLVLDKVSALGDNEKVKLFVPDGFGTYPDFVALPQADHAYTTSAQLSLAAWKSLPGPVNAFLDTYHSEYHTDLTSPQALYGVMALQVVLKAIAGTDGTRAGVHGAVFKTGVTLAADGCICGRASGIVADTGDVVAPTVTLQRIGNGALSLVGTPSLT
jgi:branched-chain amino acid transport system substrate-binding protein